MVDMETLQEKNNKYAKYHRNDSWGVFVAFTIMSPLLFSYGYEFFYWFQGEIIEVPHPAFVLVGALFYGGIMVAMGDIIIFSKLLKVFSLIAVMCWFSYFWVVLNLSWLAFAPLVPVFILLQIQMPKIKANSNKCGDDT
ncbi:hypothetical protein [Pseudoalteromonas rhizosphaerae]|uniref:Uncharacterized protein n=1 Tax=Pseudoalteromonas rhizosphaerae TaxID=2518973 RepID=A0ABW8KU87_9GAMM